MIENTTAFRVPDPSPQLMLVAKDLRKASSRLSLATDQERKFALESMAQALAANSNEIIEANKEDLKRSLADGLNESLRSRLKLDSLKLEGAIEGVRKVAQLPDPLGLSQLRRELDKNLLLDRITVPLGVIGVIFEARPDALVQIASLAIRSGNGALLKGGREASCTNQIVMSVLKEGLKSSVVKPNSLALLTTRQESMALLKLEGLVDLIIPRGSNELVQFIQENTRIPVLGHADGICHLYIDSEVDLGQAVRIAIDSKTQYPAACNSIETLLLHQNVAASFLQSAIPIFTDLGVRLLGDKASQKLGINASATEDDWSTEYLDLTLSVKVVKSSEEAIDHINSFGSKHTDAIATTNKHTADHFLQSVNSSGVFHNCSTRFADGFRYGFGAEVGISTQTLPPRGPVGLEGLVTYKYRLSGNGHIASEYASGDRSFTHKNLLS